MEEQFIAFGSRLSRFVVGTEGNISIRTHEGFAIKSSGRRLDEGSFTLCDIDGNARSNRVSKPSMEAGFHSYIYRNSHYNVIAHTHPTNVLKILCTDFIHAFAADRLFPDQVVFNGPYTKVVPYATPGPDLAYAINWSTFGIIPPLLLLQNHGIICCAQTIDQAVTMTEICEKSAEIFIGSMLLGRVHKLTDQQIEELANNSDEIYRKTQ